MSVPFFILFPERSGSTYLCELLDGHPDITCEFEIFSLQRKGSELLRRIPDADGALAKLKALYALPTQANGFKFKLPTQYKRYPEIAQYLLEHADEVRCIFLWRENLLKAAVSSQNLKRTKPVKRAQGVNLRERLDLGPLPLDIDMAQSYIERLDTNVKRHRKQAQKFKHCIELTYEQLYADPDAMMRKLTAFLGVAPPLASGEVRSTKATTDSLRQALANYDEVEQRFSGTPLAHYLDAA